MARVNENVKSRSIIYLPLFCLPLPRKHNPVIVFPIEGSELTVYVGILHKQGLELSGVPPSLEKYLLSFYEFMCDELGISYGFRISVDGVCIYNGFIYVVVTNLITKLLSGRLTSDEYELLRLIDSKVGIGDCVTALRKYEVVKGPYIWRYDSELIKLPSAMSCHVRRSLSIDKVSLSDVVDNEALANPLTRLVGILIINMYKALIENDYGTLNNYLRLYNSLWEGISDIANRVQGFKHISNTNFYIYVQDLDRVLVLETRLVFKGS